VSKYYSVEQTIELLSQLKKTVWEFATREEKLIHDLRSKVVRIRGRREDEVEQINNTLSAELEKAKVASEQLRQVVQAEYERRKAKITAAHKTGKKKRLEAVIDREGRRKHRLQTETLQSKRNHESGLANAEATCQQFRTELAGDEQTLAGLENNARKAFGGYRNLAALVSNPPSNIQPEPGKDEYQLQAEFRDLMAKTGEDLRKFSRLFLPKFFRFYWLWLVLLAGALGAVPLLQWFGKSAFTYVHASAIFGGGLVLGIVLYFVGKKQGSAMAAKISGSFGRARCILEVCGEKCEARRVQEIERVEKEFQTKTEKIHQEWDETLEEASRNREYWPKKMDEKAAALAERNETLRRLKLEYVEQELAKNIAKLTSEAEAKMRSTNETGTSHEVKVNADHEALWQPMLTEWQGRIAPLYQAIQESSSSAEKAFPPWDNPFWKTWKAPQHFEQVARFGRLNVDIPKLAELTPKALALPGPGQLSVPLVLTYPEQGSVLFETNGSGREEALGALNNLMLRLLSVSPPGRLAFTVVDPVGLGQSFSGVMHLADYAEHVINGRIWTQAAQIEQRLGDLNEHMEKVIQMYLRNEYATISEYNEQAGTIAEKYHFLVVADFPVNFSETAAKRLMSIAASGARCGVYTLIHWDRRQPVPQDFIPEELRKSSISITCKGKDITLAGRFLPGTDLRLDTPPDPETATEFIQKVGIISRDSNRIEVPFSQIAPAESELWSVESTQELRVAIGRTGATKLQYMEMGRGTRQHALVAGKTGSGKSTLFHVIVTNLALWCSPEQVEFYLIDFKKGVEFKCYAANRLPHARVVAIESDREFGLSVLQKLDEELKRRGDLFRNLGVQDVAGYKRVGGKEPMPRTLLVIDEFQEFFVEDDKIAQTASLLLDRIVRQGRAFGIHVLLGSQTLGGAYTVARTTLGQMVIRIALQCNEADAYLIMDDSNPAPRLLSRPGEGIYNDTAGTVEGNSPFQVVWLSDETRDEYLAKVRTLADRSAGKYEGPIVFEGNAPANVAENLALQSLIEAETRTRVTSPRIFMGAPNSIKGPTEAAFHRQSGNNVLIVGQREEAILSIISVGMISLAAQYRPGDVRILLLDGSAPDSPQREYLNRIVQGFPQHFTMVKQSDLPEVLGGLATEMKSRNEDTVTGAPPIFIFIHGLQKFNKLRFEEDFGFSSGDAGAAPNPSVALNELLTEGTRLGFHVIAACDTFNNVNRYFSRKAFSEFEMRVLFQMSANDSASLIDSPKASNLGMHRALFYNEQEGYLETFRPYASPGREWIEEAAVKVGKLS
jgi:S-DNA-T family DNA segregation ATPase FtsK/SpoIIIE